MPDALQEMAMSFARMAEASHLAFGAPELAREHMSACPHAMYQRVAAETPVRDLGDGYWSLTSMADIQYVTRHPAVEQGSKYLGSDRKAIPLGLDGDEHRKYRKLLDPVFTPTKVAPLAANVRQLAHELIDGFAADGQVNAYAAWCEPLPSTIFLSIMGLPMEDRDDFLHFKTLTLSTGDPSLTDEQRTARRMEAVMWIQRYFNASLDERARESAARDDMIGWLMGVEVDGHRLTRQDLLDVLGLFMIAGLDTVAASLACFLSFFARNPEQRQAVVDDPSKLKPAIEELMRFETPVTEGYRVNTEDLTLPSGPTIPAGSWMHIAWSAANLDPAVFTDALRFDPTRQPNPHIGFASGYHRCLGSHLARMEMITALAAWHERIPVYRVADGVELVYSGNPRAPHELPLVW
jgi:cytochrome P450